MFIKILVLICFMIAMLIIFLYNDPEGERVDIFLADNKGRQSICQSQVIPTPDYTIDRNLIYCGSFQLVWNELKKLVGEDIHISGQPEMTDKLNHDPFSKESIALSDYYVNYGFGKEDIILQINNDLLDRFGHNAPEKIKMVLRPDDMILYAYLFKELEFKYAFDKIDESLVFKSGKETSNVKAYGINSYRSYKHPHLKDQADIMYYENEDDFIVRLNTSQKNDEYILAKIKPQQTLRDTYKYVYDRIANSKKDVLKERDTLIIPYINIDITRKYNELIHRPFINHQMEGKYISDAIQNIKFAAGEKGAVVSSEAKLIFSRETVWESRKMVFNAPFMVILKRKRTVEPYLLIWVNDADLLVKS